MGNKEKYLGGIGKKQGISKGREEDRKYSWLCARGLGEGTG